MLVVVAVEVELVEPQVLADPVEVELVQMEAQPQVVMVQQIQVAEPVAALVVTLANTQ
jgi:hypothetical protein